MRAAGPQKIVVGHAAGISGVEIGSGDAPQAAASCTAAGPLGVMPLTVPLLQSARVMACPGW